MKRVLFWVAYVPLALSLLAISAPGIALALIEATYRGLVMVYDELLRRFETWCFDYGPVHQSLWDIFLAEFRENAVWKQL